jgi:NTE family protein
MYGLALEGGGAKGAYHLGVIKAFLECGYEFGGVTGTSIGALNGAIIAQGDFEKGYNLWENLDPTLLFAIDKEEYKKIVDKDIDKDVIAGVLSKLRKVVKNKGIDTNKMRQVISGIVDEKKLRNSKIDFGLVTVSLSDMKPVEIFKEDIPEGKMIDYLMASASFPGFKLQPMDDKYYIDGGFYDNCPINLLAQRGYRDIIAIRTNAAGITRKIENQDVKVTYIIPSENLGSLLNFDNNVAIIEYIL